MALVLSHKRGVAVSQKNPKISQQPLKPYNFYGSSGKCSKFGLYTRTRYISLFLGDFQAIGEEPRMQYLVMERRSFRSLAQVDPSGFQVSTKLKWIVTSIE
jgi:hypothetical protein